MSDNETPIKIGVLLDDQKSIELDAIRTTNGYGDLVAVLPGRGVNQVLTAWRELDPARRRFEWRINSDAPPRVMFVWYTDQLGLELGEVFPFFDGTTETSLYQLAALRDSLPTGMLRYGSEIGELDL